MSVEFVGSWGILMHYAKELGKARQSGDEKRIMEAKLKHDNYVYFCIHFADHIAVPYTTGELTDGTLVCRELPDAS